MKTQSDIDRKIISNTILTIQNLVKGIIINPVIPSITEWAERSRYLPAGTSDKPGMWEAAYVPYAVEIQENLHKDSGIRITSIIKSAQSLVTTSIENAIGHSIKYEQHNILYVISDMAMARIRSMYAIDVLIDMCGLSEYIHPVTKRAGQRKTGDMTLYKELAGGRRFMITSYNSIAKLKSFSWDFIIMDELDEAPPELAGQGDPEAIIEERGKTIENLKVVKLATSREAENSRIYRAFKDGDRREYLIPCPRCGGMQHLELMFIDKEYGLYADYNYDQQGKASLIAGSARYKCKHCAGDFYDHEKPAFMLEKSLGGLAHWEPTENARDSRNRSYHISAMMSPMTSWNNIMADYVKTDFGKIMQAYKNFSITTLGWPYFKSVRMKMWTELKERAQDYDIGKVPEGGLLITGGVDVQKNRLELQLMAWGYNMECWSFDHQVFFGATADIQSEAWRNLNSYCSKPYTIPGIDAEVYITRVGIDASYNPNKDPSVDNNLRMEMNAVYAFCKESGRRFVPVRGIEDTVATQLIAQKRHSRYDIQFYIVDVDAIKDEIFENIDKKEGAHAIHFSSHYHDEFFRQFMSEAYTIRDNGKYGYNKIYDRNEVLDTAVYNRAVMTILGADRWDIGDWDVWRSEISDKTE